MLITVYFEVPTAEREFRQKSETLDRLVTMFGGVVGDSGVCLVTGRRDVECAMPDDKAAACATELRKAGFEVECDELADFIARGQRAQEAVDQIIAEAAADDASLASNAAIIKKRIEDEKVRLRKHLDEWIDQYTLNLNDVAITGALLETALERQIDLHGEQGRPRFGAVGFPQDCEKAKAATAMIFGMSFRIAANAHRLTSPRDPIISNTSGHRGDEDV